VNPVETAQLTLPDRVRGWFSANYAAKASVNRYIEQNTRRASRDYRSGRQRRTDRGYTGQPWGTSGTRTLTPIARRNMVQRSREIDENNILGSSLLDRAADNIIGQGMVLQARTTSKRFNKQVEALWANYDPDVRGMVCWPNLQHAWYRAARCDGDLGLLLLRSGKIQTIEGDYIQTPAGAGSNVIDGVEINTPGRPTRFHVASVKSDGRTDHTAVDARNFVWYTHTNRLNRTAVRGVPVLAQLGWLLEQIDGTFEAVTMAHRLGASFGLLRKSGNPGTQFDALAGVTPNADGDDQNRILIEPAMVEFIGKDEDVIQIKPEQPGAVFGDFMRLLIRISGLKLGLPLELALLDFSDTNYSSARASMEQAYRRFRIEQHTFGCRVLKRIYEWRVSKWMKEGLLPERSDAFEHRWLGQPWPYLDPQKEAEGALVAVDAGFTTLHDELMRRGLQFDEWLRIRSEEIKAIVAAGIPVTHSGKTREVGAEPTATPGQPNSDGDSNTEGNEDAD
jgi:lambda family phage portal protein